MSAAAESGRGGVMLRGIRTTVHRRVPHGCVTRTGRHRDQLARGKLELKSASHTVLVVCTSRCPPG